MIENNKYVILKKVINEFDPIGLIDVDTPESYEDYVPEIKAILDRIVDFSDYKELGILIHRVFVEYFGKEQAGDREKYEKIAGEYLDRVKMQEKDYV